MRSDWPGTYVRRVQRQRSEIDAGDVGACHSSRSAIKAFSISSRTRLGRRSDLATAPRGAAGTPGRVDHRRDQLSQTGHALGRSGASVLWRAGQDRELPSRRDGRAVDGGTRVADRRVVVSPESVADESDRRAVAQIPGGVSFQEKWRQALTLIRRARAAGLQMTAVLADAEFGDVTAFRRALHAGVCPMPSAFAASHRVSGHAGGSCPAESARIGRPRSQLVLRTTHGRSRASAGVDAAGTGVATGDLAQRDESPVGGSLRGRARHAGHDWRDRRLAPEVWLLCEQDLGATPRTKYFFINLPRHGVGETIGPPRASTLGDRAAVSRAQDRTRLRPLRRPLVSRDGNIMSC